MSLIEKMTDIAAELIRRTALNVHRARCRAGLTIEELASLAAKSPEWLRECEAGRVDLSVSELGMLAQQLDEHAQSFLYEADFSEWAEPALFQPVAAAIRSHLAAAGGRKRFWAQLTALGLTEPDARRMTSLAERGTMCPLEDFEHMDAACKRLRNLHSTPNSIPNAS